MRQPARVATVWPVNEFRVAHLSDTHIGYEAYKTLSASGENQRAVDIARAFVTACDDIVASDPALVIHSGDVADRTVIPVRLMLLIRREITKLAGLRPDGTRRQVVIVAGNHEQPRNRKEACFLELFRGIPGVHVATGGYEHIRFDGAGSSYDCDPALLTAVVHAIPHDALKSVDFDVVRPLDGVVNILTSHGVAGGSELFVRSLGREFAIPTDVLAREWDYVALGHWHRQGPVPIASTGALTRSARARLAQTHDHDPLADAASCCSGPDAVDPDGGIGRVWYAGSTENCGFGDLKDNGQRRGWLDVTINPGDLPTVSRRYVPIRAMFRLPVVDGVDLTPEQITDTLLDRIHQAPIHGAVVGQVVDNVSRDVWSLVDLTRVRAAAAAALHYDVALRPIRSVTDRSERVEHRGIAEAASVLAERAAGITDVSLRDDVLTYASSLLSRQLERIDRERDAARTAASNDGDTTLTVTLDTATEPIPAPVTDHSPLSPVTTSEVAR